MLYVLNAKLTDCLLIELNVTPQEKPEIRFDLKKLIFV